MRFPSLFRWSSRWFRGSALFALLCIGGLALANLIDAFPYWRALQRVQNLDEQSLQAIATACAQYPTEARYQQLQGDDIPSVFRILKPTHVFNDHGYTEISLFSRNDYLYVSLSVRTNPENQVITCHTGNFKRWQSRKLWERNPAFTRQMNPAGRLVTFTLFSFRSSHREWIVRPDELLVIDRSSHAGQADKISARVPLSVKQITEIEAALRSIGPNIRNHAYDSGGIDGVTLRISFTPDGSQCDDVILANTWREEANPLVNAFIHVLGQDAMSQLQETIEWLKDPRHCGNVTTKTLKEYDDAYNRMPLPWWRLWPRFCD